ncbi:MAG: phenylalanine--tRNA ligase subunit beta [Candidatus Aenigmatarchaeota archaeon]
MPMIELSLSDLEKLVGRKLPHDTEKLNDVLQFAKSEVERLEGDDLTVTVEDGNRLDLWCAEGIARELRGALGIETGMAEYNISKSDYTVAVDKELEKIRPFIACAVVKGAKLNDQILKQLMQQQEKIDGTYGRNRKRSSIGLYDLDKIKWPLKYTVTNPGENAFVPLGFDKAMTPAEILENHPKGKEYGKILDGCRLYPIFKDADGQVLSFPPIINSNDIGKVTGSTKNVLVEVTGSDWQTVNAVLLVVAMSLADRGGKMHSVTATYPYKLPDGSLKATTPEAEPRALTVDLDEISGVLGFEMGATEAEKLLKKARYDAVAELDKIKVFVPAHRADVMHPVDIMEDMVIMKGLNNLPPVAPLIPTAGTLSKLESVTNRIREICIGLGCQELLTFTLTNRKNLFERMGTEEGKVIEVENPVSSEFICLRSKLMPGLLQVLSENKHRDFPQNVFEVGDCVVPDEKEENGARQTRRLAILMSHDKVNLTGIKSTAEALLRNLGIEFEIKPTKHPSFIETRCGEIKIGGRLAGIFGEIHPKVLRNWDLDLPAAAIEIELDALKKF